jgi:hypothetical protein
MGVVKEFEDRRVSLAIAGSSVPESWRLLLGPPRHPLTRSGLGTH